jgi:hypothetical protein
MASLQVYPGWRYGQPPGIVREEVLPAYRYSQEGDMVSSRYSQGGDMASLQV